MPDKRNPDEPFLTPIEDPEDPALKQLYAMYKQWFGVVATPVRVHSARLPPSFAQLYGKIGELDRELKLPQEMARLVRAQVARLNVCLFCMDSNRAAVMMSSPASLAKYDALDEYGTSPLFTDAERAALDYVTHLARDKKVDPDVFDRMARHYSEREICEIVYLVASEHVFNMTNIGLNIHSDMLCDLLKKRKYEQAKKG
ncbi:MAG: carboxymuconolactone decarboxylase family protein [Nitrososphaerota archaeon]|nr:carboxymuconolactone decarboxylase family protein [Nitrososphaerota archaeon]